MPSDAFVFFKGNIFSMYLQRDVNTFNAQFFQINTVFFLIKDE